MSSAKALTKFVRISPQKARLVADMIRGKKVTEARNVLHFSPLKGARLIAKTLHSAVANAESRLSLREEQLKVSEIRIDEGPTLKRARPKCRGGRVPIHKRTSHFYIEVTTE